MSSGQEARGLKIGRIEAITGKYINVPVHGHDFRVYFEESGSGIPLVCQHTAASDGRQWRHFLNDEDVTSRYRVIVPDLPYHGRSLPPESLDWWKEEYRLTKRFFVDFHTEFNQALGLARPVYMGCSFGGTLAVDLAFECPGEYRAVIGLESGLAMPWQTPILDWFDHPRINNTFRAQAMYGKTAPNSPEKYRREIAWVYSQSAPSVFKGDLYFHFVDHDLTAEQADRIDTSRTPVYLLTGEYDWGNSPDVTRQLAGYIKGSRFTEMKGVGHFPMCENFDLFKGYIMPILLEIAGSEKI